MLRTTARSLARAAPIAAAAGLAAALAAGCGADSDVSRTIGARCDRMDECDERCVVDAEDYPGGFCTVSCLSARDCPDGAACVDDDGGICLFTCAVDADCEFLGPTWRCAERDARPETAGKVKVCRGA
ncbi:MAG: hypothetical protein D6689_04650 [Deltaproteobacteria bacterium]|nr:MAG: hypothetical protein D6689_04650 [Deltaproteobacteria bacterium]